ncbi:hypothetical protein LTR27_006632 [Elasticomyces elasticus]|nr:hypothetical protein LTR27_006632 [Elasticomyces elasticus]
MADSSGSAVSSASESDATAPPTQQTSKLLTIAPELRNSIYELVFTKPPGPTDLLTASQPTSNLRLVCKQTRCEARGLWLTANRDYWTTTTFTIHRETVHSNDMCTPIRLNFTTKDLSSIRTIRFTSAMLHIPRLGHLFIAQNISFHDTQLYTFEHDAENPGQWRLTMVDGAVLEHGTQVFSMHIEEKPCFTTPKVTRIASPSWRPKIVTRADLSVLVGREVVLRVRQKADSSGGCAAGLRTLRIS